MANPRTSQEVPVVVHCRDPGEDVTVYPVMAEPPSPAGPLHETVADPSPAVALTPVGAPGTVRGVAVIDPEAAPGPMVFTARTRIG